MNKPNSAGMADRICCVEAVAGMQGLPDGCIPLTVTSPPYDSLRRYGGHPFDSESFGKIADELYRVTMPGGVVAWVVADAIVDGSETGTSFRQALHFKEVGFRLHHTMVMHSRGMRAAPPVRYGNALQYALILSKGRPRYVNLLRDRPNRHAGCKARYNERLVGGDFGRRPTGTVPEWGFRGPVWEYSVGRGNTTRDGYAFEHPALMPEKMAEDHILSWSRPGDLVLDPMAGAATTCKMAMLNHRQYLGFEVHRPYYQLARRRMRDAQAEYRRRLDAWLVGA